MKKIFWIPLAVCATGAAWYTLGRDTADADEIQYRFAAAEKGEIVRSISATGILVALTTVDVKSKAGGKVVQLLVEEGSVVKKGDTIALIDPDDTKSIYNQAEADLQSSEARASQAAQNYDLQVASSMTAIQDADANVKTAKARLARVRLETERQPTLTNSSISQAKASFDAATEALRRMNEVTIPQMLRDAEGQSSSTFASYEAAKSDLERQRYLMAKGYVAQSTVDRALSAYESAKTNYDNAQQRKKTISQDVSASRKAAELDVTRTRSAYESAKANGSQDQISQQSLVEAKVALVLAETALRRAHDNRRNNEIRRADVAAASASTVRSKVALQNAKVQLDSTTVVAPRDGVVTQKYLEEGTIIPPGTSTFAQGTSLVQLSDVTKMFVECAVDEADIGEVKVGQKVRVVTEAFPGVRIRGIVTRINPAAKTEQNITAIKVRVELLPGEKVKLSPGLNATCEFITLSKKDVLLVPSQAIQHEGDKTFVKLEAKGAKKPVRRDVVVGEAGNDGVEIVSGLSEGEKVVIAELNLKLLKETQQKMQEAAQGGGGLAGGSGMPRGMGGGRTGGATGGTGGARTGGGGGGARMGTGGAR